LRDYIIGTGYYESSEKDKEFYEKYWFPNTIEHASPKKIVVINSGSPNRKVSTENWIDLTENPGHTDQMRASGDTTQFGGWTLGFINAAMYAYSCKCDFFYKEQDCLAFGDWAEKIRQESIEKDRPIMVGRLIDYPHDQGDYELCLTYIRYEFILSFLIELFAINRSDKDCFCETKFKMIGDKTNTIGRVSFGYGGNRPFNADDPIFYIQKPRWWPLEKKDNSVGHSGVPQEEIDALIKAGLLNE